MAEGNADRIADYIKCEYSRMARFVRTRICEAADRDSEDIVSEVVTRLFERADISEPIENLGAYLYRSLTNHIVDILRKKDRSVTYLEDEDLSEKQCLPANNDGSPCEWIEKNEVATALCQEVMQLPDELRSVFVMNEIDGKTYREISELTGIPAGTLMARKARAVERLAQKLSRLRIYLED